MSDWLDFCEQLRSILTTVPGLTTVHGVSDVPMFAKLWLISNIQMRLCCARNTILWLCNCPRVCRPLKLLSFRFPFSKHKKIFLNMKKRKTWISEFKTYCIKYCKLQSIIMRNTNGSTLAYSLLVIGVGVLFFIIHEQKDDLRNGTDYLTNKQLTIIAERSFILDGWTSKELRPFLLYR